MNRSSPVLALFYLGGHPGIWSNDQPFLVGRVDDQIRLLTGKGRSVYDLPISRITGASYDDTGLLRISFEPTPGLITSVDFLVGGDLPVEEAYTRLLAMLQPKAQVH